MLPLRSVGRSNFVMVCVNKFNNVDSKATYFDENCCVIYIYILINSSSIRKKQEIMADNGKTCLHRH